jgi:hypothetical protein
MERNGVFQIPWGAGNYTWPEQLFWENMPDLFNQHGQEMTAGGDGVEASGRAPIMSCVAWGYEYKAATGGDPANGIGDKSQSPGWKQWGEWLKAREDKYIAHDWHGKPYYPYAGYVTPLMPLDSVDWPEGIPNATFGDWAGERLGKLANHIHSRGFFAADFVVGLYGSNHDFHPRVIADFEKWAGVTIPQDSTYGRFQFILKNLWPVWNDYKSHRFAQFYARAAETIRKSGREPLVGGQILPNAAAVRGSGNDFRIYLQHLPAKNWFFQVETQSDEGRPVQPYWNSATVMGGHAGRAADFTLGAHMDAYQSNFWNSVIGNNKKDSAWGVAYMKHTWLATGWTHHARTDGSVQRSAQSFQRAYWDAGGIDTPVVALLRNHIPRHPFGPAFYYSTDLERQSEAAGHENFYWWFEPKTLAWRNQGVPGGYFVSDSSLDKLTPANRPSGWFVYVDNLGMTKLKPEEKSRLEKIAPILSEDQVRDSCPVSFEGDSLGGYAFIDQRGSVIVVVSNSDEKPVSGALRFAKVENGRYGVKELLRTLWPLKDTLVIEANKGRIPITVVGRDTRVFEIPALREKGRAKLDLGIVSKKRGPGTPSSGIFRRDGKRLDILGRQNSSGPALGWSADPRP